MQEEKDGKKEKNSREGAEIRLMRARWDKQAGAFQIWQERPTAKSHMTNTNSESASELPVMFLLEWY